jgi:hypothetical protein
MKQKRYFIEGVVTKSTFETEGVNIIPSAEFTDNIKVGSVEIKSVQPLDLTTPISSTEIYSFPAGLYNLAEFTITLVDSENSYVFGRSFSVAHNGSSTAVSNAYAEVDLWGTVKPTFSASISGENVKLYLTTTSDSVNVSLSVKLHSSEVSQFINITSQPTSQTVVEGDVPAVFSVIASTNDGGTLSYQWQEDSGTGFVDLTDSPTYSGSLTSSLTITTTDTSLTGYSYRCRISSSGSAPDEFTNTVTLTVSAAEVTITSNPTNLSVNSGDPAIFTVEATTNEVSSTLVYEWQEDDGSGFTVLTEDTIYTGTNTDTLTITNSAGLDGYLYRCRVTTTSAISPEATSNSATLTVVIV